MVLLSRRAARFRAILTAALALAGVAVWTPARAQAAKRTVTAGLGDRLTIVQPPMTIDGVKGLNFGTLTPGIPVTVLPTSVQAGEGRGTGADFVHSITTTLTLPTVLTGPGGATLPVSFNGNYAGSCEINNSNVCDVASRQTWNPVVTPTHTDTPFNTGPGNTYRYPRYSVYVGGRVTPAASQRAGVYTGTIGITVVWN
ncbi:MAG TPA: DUF4402 domain-containing protein [Longimicrobiaceae bacterium]|nr:DUF4402 domain-containing protein [Longimicrobiaceae bacterium]